MTDLKLRLVVDNTLHDVPLGDPAELCIDFFDDPMESAEEAYERQARYLAALAEAKASRVASLEEIRKWAR
jgi:hypothetical protein